MQLSASPPSPSAESRIQSTYKSSYKGVLQIMGKWQDTERAEADAVFGSLDAE